MPESNIPLSTDDFTDDAIRRELLSIVRDKEVELLAKFDAKMSEIRAKGESLGEGPEGACSIVWAQLETARSTHIPSYFLRMRDFIERQ